MVKEPQNRAISREYEDPAVEVTIPSREQQWLDVVGRPAPPLAPQIEPTETIPCPEVPFAWPEPAATSHLPEVEQAYSTATRCLAIIVLTALFLLAWQEKVGDESTVTRIRASSLLDR